MWVPRSRVTEPVGILRARQADSVVQDDAQEGAVDLERAVVLDESELRNLFMKKFTRERVVPTISASVSCEIFGSTRCGVARRRSGRAAAACAPAVFRSS